MTQYEPLTASTARRQHWSWSGWWWQEILSNLTSLGCMVGVIVILKIMENQNTDHWGFYLSLNATIALVITAAKSTAMLSVAACISQWKWVYFSSGSRKLTHFDLIEEASRGPVGSLGMIFRVPWSMATLGAVVTIVALGIDTFAQQVISLDTTTAWVNDSSAYFGLAHEYHVNTEAALFTAEFSYYPFTVDTAMQGTVYKAFYGLDTPAVFNCSSNCTWSDSYISLGFSSTCLNVTQATYATKNCTTDETNGGQNCTMTTPGNVTFTTAEVPTDWDTAMLIKAKSMYDSYINDLTSSIPPRFMRIAAFRQPSAYSGDAAIEEVLDCDISFAAYKYTNATSTSNDFTIQTTEILSLDPGHFVRTWTNKTTAAPDSILFNTSGLPDFIVSTSDLGALLDFFPSDSFSGMLVDGEDTPVYAQGITAALRDPQKNITALFTSMATAMTDQLRSGYDVTADGLSAQSVVLVRVQWAWLALPSFVVFASTVFLLAEMVQSRRGRGISLWKSSSTALLFHSVSSDMSTLTTWLRGPEQLRKVVEDTRVRLHGGQVEKQIDPLVPTEYPGYILQTVEPSQKK